MIVIAILGIALAFAAPSLSNFINQTRIKNVAENLSQDFILARTEASRINKNIRLNIATSCYGFTTNITDGCDCSETDPDDSNYCEIKRQGDWRNVEITPSDDLDGLIFDSIRGIPANMTATQTVNISNSSGEATLAITVIGGVCLSSSAGATKIPGYKDAC